MNEPVTHRRRTDIALPADGPAGPNGAAPRGPSSDRRLTNRKPKIVIRQRLAETVDLAEAILLATPELGLYRRGGQLVQVVRSPDEGAPGLDSLPAGSVIHPVSADCLREILDRSADWNRRNAAGKEVPSLPPMWVANTLMSRAQSNLSPLIRISSTPIFRADGTVQDEPGYDDSTSVYYDPGRTVLPPLKDRPGLDDAITAWEELREPFTDFAFVGESDFSTLIATLLALIARDAIDGPCPLTAVRAPTPGAGKGLVADSVAVLAVGHKVPRTAPPRDDNEMRKHILAIGLDARPLVLIDNVTGSFGSPSIAAALTSTRFSDRVLGLSRTATVPMRAVWMLTGNNTSFRGDLGRRVIPCDLDPRVEHPEERTGFKHPDLLDYLKQERPRLVRAVLTILRAYFLAGLPPHGKPRKGSFERWDDVVRGAVMWVGAVDPLEGQERVREIGDLDLESLRALLHAWFDRFGATAHTLSDVLEETANVGAFRAVLAEACRSDPSQLSATRLGYGFRGFAGRIASGMRFEREAGRSHGAVRWHVVKGDGLGCDGGDGGDGGDDFARPNSSSPERENPDG